MEWYWLSSARMTVFAKTRADQIIDTSPITQCFTGQPLSNLIGWMKRQGGFRLYRYKKRKRW